ncbi:MAG: acyltransferase family protein [Pseudomonadota bacterium]
MNYRPDIDGMRAIAVLAVVVYHLKIPIASGKLLQGGFLGVDVFFVLSGFLITRLLLDELEARGRVSISSFYSRRARRILPPLLLVMLVSLPAAWALLQPSEMVTFGKSLLASLIFFANGFWFFEQGAYGAQSALMQPFLHIWSLAVEEQFYFIFPVALTFLVKIRRPGWAMIALGGAFFAISWVHTILMPNLSFFSPLSRAWELLAGAALAIYAPALLASQTSIMFRYVPSVCLAALLGTLVFVDFDMVTHPGPITLIPVLATCGLIAFSNPGDPATRLLCTRPLISIGLISYALYLWHYPIFAFGRRVTLEPGISDMLVWVALAFIGSTLSYFLVERPLRHSAGAFLFGSVTAAAGIATFVFALGLVVATPDRGPRHWSGPANPDNGTLKAASWQILDDMGPPRRVFESNPHDRPSWSEKHATWYDEDARVNVLVVGNSHAKDLFNAFYLNRALYPNHSFARFGIAPGLSKNQLNALEASPNFKAADLILYAPRYDSHHLEPTRRFIQKVRQLGKEIVLVSNTAEFETPSWLPLQDHLLLTRQELSPETANAEAANWINPRLDDLNTSLAMLAQEEGVAFADRFSVVCPDQEAACVLLLPDGRKALYDYAHWTVEGARHFGTNLFSWLEIAPPNQAQLGASRQN